jgi:CRISPR-associated exonuclease Cas4
MQITGTHIHYYFNCHRQLWLFANGINMEHTSDVVSHGKLIHETTYQQRTERFREIEIGSIKIDFFDQHSKVIHEVKKSSKLFESHVWQVKYYIYILEQTGLKGVTGILEYPKERKIEEVFLSEPDRVFLQDILEKIDQLIHSENCPPVIYKPKCKNCSYFDFCYATEI